MEHYYDIVYELKEDGNHILTCAEIPNFYLVGADLDMLKRDVDPVIRKLRGLTADSNCNWIMVN